MRRTTRLAQLFSAVYGKSPPGRLAATVRADPWLRFALGIPPRHRLAETNRAQLAQARRFVRQLDLWRGYRDATVVVDGDRLRVGAPGPRGLVVLTAWNPQSIRRTAAENRLANQRLAKALARLGLHPRAARNAPGTAWAEEALAVTIPTHRLPPLVDLAHRFGQLAIYATVRGRFALVARRAGQLVVYAGVPSGPPSGSPS